MKLSPPLVSSFIDDGVIMSIITVFRNEVIMVITTIHYHNYQHIAHPYFIAEYSVLPM